MRPRDDENSARSAIDKYCFCLNLRSNASNCCVVKGVRGLRLFLCFLSVHLFGFMGGRSPALAAFIVFESGRVLGSQFHELIILLPLAEDLDALCPLECCWLSFIGERIARESLSELELDTPTPNGGRGMAKCCAGIMLDWASGVDVVFRLDDEDRDEAGDEDEFERG